MQRLCGKESDEGSRVSGSVLCRDTCIRNECCRVTIAVIYSGSILIHHFAGPSISIMERQLGEYLNTKLRETARL